MLFKRNEVIQALFYIFHTDTVPYQEMKESASQADALGEKVQYGIRTVLRS